MQQYNTKSRRVFVIINVLFLACLVMSMVLPLVNSFALSFSTDLNSMKSSMTFWPSPFSLQGYDTLFFVVDIGRPFINTLYITIVGSFLHVIFCAITAYALSRYEFPGKGIFTALLLVTMMIPFQNIMIPSYLLYRNLGLLNTQTSIIITGAITGFTVVLLKNFFDEIPKSISESALIEGANEWHMLFKIFFPLAKPGLATVSIFQVITRWNMFMEPLIFITSPQKQMLQVKLRALVIEQEGLQDLGIVSRNAQMAGVMLTIIPLIIMYPFAQKYFINGLTLGSTKG